MELTGHERKVLRGLVESALAERTDDPVLASLAARLVAGGGPSFAKYAEVLESPRESDPEIAARVRQAVQGAERLSIRYTARTTGATTERVVRPWNIHFYDGREYLEAFCELRGEDRVFAVGNIEAILPISDPGSANHAVEPGQQA